MKTNRPVGIRWTIGDVSERGFEALALSLRGAWTLFGGSADYAVCVNSIPPASARQRAGSLPMPVAWHDSSSLVPSFLAERFAANMAEGVGWKLAPLRLFPDRHELSLDNDCILWDRPTALRRWLDSDHQCLIAEDVKRCLGQFADWCGPEARNSGIRGLPPGFDLEAAMRVVLAQAEARLGRPVVMESELDEQGLQTAALSLNGPPLAVELEEVTICSPFWPHAPELGRCGAHFVGLNARHIPWNYYDRSADSWMSDHWARHRQSLAERVAGHRVTASPSPIADKAPAGAPSVRRSGDPTRPASR